MLNMIGLQRTKDIVMRTKRVSGKRAHDWGIASECVPDDALEDTVVSLVNELTQFSALAQRTSKNLLTAAQDAPLHVGIKMEGEAYGRLRSSNDFREGVESFNAKRKPKFRGG